MCSISQGHVCAMLHACFNLPRLWRFPTRSAANVRVHHYHAPAAKYDVLGITSVYTYHPHIQAAKSSSCMHACPDSLTFRVIAHARYVCRFLALPCFRVRTSSNPCTQQRSTLSTLLLDMLQQQKSIPLALDPGGALLNNGRHSIQRELNRKHGIHQHHPALRTDSRQ